MSGYQRQAAANMQPDLLIRAEDLNAEFNALEAAMNASTGHTHNGNVGEGAKIDLVNSITGILPDANLPSTMSAKTFTGDITTNVGDVIVNSNSGSAPIRIVSTTSNGISITRTAATINSSIAFIPGGGGDSIFVGLGASGTFAVRNNAALNSSPWISATSGRFSAAGDIRATTDVIADSGVFAREALGGGTISLRPNGPGSTTGQATLSQAGQLSLSGGLITQGLASINGGAAITGTLTTTSFADIGGPLSVTGTGTFSGAISTSAVFSTGDIVVSAGSSSPLQINRAATTNVSVQATATSGGTSVFFGHGTASTFAVSGTANLTSSPWFSITSTQAVFNTSISGVGNITTSGGGIIRNYVGTSSNAGYMYIKGNTTSGNAILFNNGANGAPPDGNTIGSISVTASATAYNTSSDYRLKHDVADFTDSGSYIDALRPVTFKWNVDDSDDIGFIAHEVQEVFPQAVNGEKDAEVMQGGDWTKLVPILVAEIKSLRARVAQLEAAV